MFRFAAVVLAMLTVPAAAQTPTDRLTALLGEVPSLLLDPQDGVEVTFTDATVSRRVVETDSAILPWRLGQQQRVLSHGSLDAAALDLDNIAAILEVSTPPRRALVMDLVAPDVAAIEAGLRDLGYAQEGAVWWRGVAGEMDFDALADPFSGGIGAPARIEFRGDRLVQTVTWASIRARGTSLADVAILQSLLGALDGKGQVLSAYLRVSNSPLAPSAGAAIFDVVEADGSRTAVLAMIAAPDAVETVRANWARPAPADPILGPLQQALGETEERPVPAQIVGADPLIEAVAGPLPVIRVSVQDPAPEAYNLTQRRMMDLLLYGGLAGLTVPRAPSP